LSADLQQLRLRHPDLDAGIAVASGTVVAGNIGSASRYEYTVIGDPVNVAARLCELAKSSPERLLVDAASVAAAGADEGAHWQPRGDVELRGRQRVATVYAPVEHAMTPARV
jgi:adenylate cyclase